MKKAFLGVLLSLTMLGCGTALYAQMQEGSGQGGGMGHMGPMSTDQRLQHMTQMLNLTSDQQQKIRPILENESQQMQTLRQDTSMAREDKMTKMRSIRETSMSQITPILTPDQQKKWQEQMQMRRRPPSAGSTAPEQGTPPPQQ